MSKRTDLPSKTCARCGRRFEWRKKWERCWESVRYCSAACRGGKRTAADEALERAIGRLLGGRRAGSSVCPSEAARAVAGEEGDWRSLMEPARCAARRLEARGVVEVTQGGRVVDPSTAKGPIRVRLRQ